MANVLVVGSQWGDEGWGGVDALQVFVVRDMKSWAVDEKAGIGLFDRESTHNQCDAFRKEGCQ